jgi:hypothetical protein
VTGYLFAATCGYCGGRLAHVNGSATGSQTLAVAKCGHCAREWCVTVTLRPLVAEASRRRAELRGREEVSA